MTKPLAPHVGLCLIACMGGLGPSSETWAQTFSSVKVMDRSTPLSGGGGVNSPQTPSYDGTIVVTECGSTSGGIRYVLKWTQAGGVVEVARLGTAAPGPGGTASYTSFDGYPRVADGNVAFRAELSTSSSDAIFSDVTGSLARSVDQFATPCPEPSPAGYQYLYSPRIAGGLITFLADCAPFPAAQSVARAPSTALVLHGAQMPGAAPGIVFSNFTILETSTSLIAFRGADPSSTIQGVFSLPAAGGSISQVIYEGTPVPGVNDTVRFVDQLVVDGSTIGFVIRGFTGYTAIYKSTGGTLTKLIDSSATAPSGSAFTRVGAPSFSGGKFCFYGETADFKAGVYTNHNGAIQKVIATGDVIGGAAVNLLLNECIGPGSYHGSKVAVTLGNGTSTSGIYLFDLASAGGGNQPPVVNDQTFSIAAKSKRGAPVGTIVATDPDAGQRLTYAITTGNSSSAFKLNSSTGELTVNSGLAIRRPTTFTLGVRVTDNGTPAANDTATITVNVTP